MIIQLKLPIAFSEAGVGSQNSTLLGATGDSVSWMTNYTWANGPNNVKSCEFCIDIME